MSESYKKKHINSKQWGDWKPKIIRVLVPYVFVVIATFLWDCFIGVSFTVPTYWYISFMFFWYIVFFLIIQVRGAYDLRYWILGIASVTVFMLGNSLQAEQALSFFFGVLISDHQEYAENKMTNSKFLLFLFILGCCLLGLKQVPVIRNLQGNYIWYVLQLVMKLSLALMIIGATQKYQEVVSNKLIFYGGNILRVLPNSF